MDLTSRDPLADYPALCGLVTAFKLAHADDEAAGRAADNAIRHLRSTPVLAFDGVELRVLSESADDGTEYVTDGETCTCKAKSHAWCKHRVMFRLLAGLATLRGPGVLRSTIIEQAVPPVVAPIAAAPAPAPWESDPEYLTFTPRQSWGEAPPSGAPAAPRSETRRQRAMREMAELYA